MKKISSGNFIMIIFLIMMAYNAFQSRPASIGDWLLQLVISLPGIVIGITIHEFAHAFAAYKLGDMTPKLQGRVTLNPLAHIDPIGIVCLIFVHFGWGRPVQVDPNAFKTHRRLCNLITDIAGVCTNFVFAFIFMGVYKGLLISGAFSSGSMGAAILYYIIYMIIQMNIILMIFNLLPIPPLDGFGIITEIFDLRRFRWYQPFYQNGSLILLILIIFNITSGLLSPAMNAITTLFENIWGVILI
jgi:Zn-dependent protease